MKLLLVEDNLQLAHWLASLLRAQSFVVDHVQDGDDADRLLRDAGYDVVLLDLNIPGLPGKSVLRRLRERRDAVPVLVLTATASLDQKVLCLEMGADDYLVKPVEVRELVARIKTLVRRRMPDKANDVVLGDLVYDLRTRAFTLAGAAMALPPRERSVLEALALRAGSTVGKQALVDSVFALDEDGSTDAIEIYVHRLRRKLEASQATIVTLRGVGYLLRAREDA